jgi:large subunit ribosomal protein L30e
MKSGKYTLGYKTVLRTLRNSKCKSFLSSNNVCGRAFRSM